MRHDQAIQAMCRQTYQPLPDSDRQVIHGTPISPTSRLLAMDRTSFCVSYWSRRPLAPYLDRLAPDGTLLLDCGAYSVWQHNVRAAAAGRPTIQVDDAYWAGYYAWALPILEQVPQAALIIPDVIMGSEAGNRRLVTSLPPEIPTDRAIPVWHLHEPLEYLAWLAERFGHIAFGSSGEFRSPGTVHWRQRIRQALEHLDALCADPANGLCRPRVHMLRGLGPMRDSEFELTSGDSTNLARNGHLWIRKGRPIVDFQRKLEARRYPRHQGPLWPAPSTGAIRSGKRRKALQMPLFVPA